MNAFEWGRVVIASLVAAIFKLVVWDGVLELRGALGPLDALVSFGVFAGCFVLLGGRFGKKNTEEG